MQSTHGREAEIELAEAASPADATGSASGAAVRRARRISPWKTLGGLIPRILVLWVILDAVLRLVPLTSFHVVNFIIARKFRKLDSPFRPNVRIVSDYFRGDDAIGGNLPAREHLPPITFSTDRFGFRNRNAVSQKPVDMVVFRGFSFTWGAGLSDDQTLPAVLSALLDKPVYNAARFQEDFETPEALDALLRDLHSQPKTFIYVQTEATPHTRDWLKPRGAAERTAFRLGGESAWRAERQMLNVYRLSKDVVTISPLNRITELISNGLSNDVWRPNKARERVKTYRLPDATTMLTRTGDLEWILNPPDDRTTADRADYIAWWRDRLAERGIHMYVVLVPAKLSVYGPLLGEAVPPLPLPRSS